MKLLFVACFALSFLGLAEAACNCYPNQNVSSTVAAVTIGGPTESGGFGSPACGPINCTTTVTFYGNLNNSLPAGALVSIVQCANLSTTNTVTLSANNQTFSSCPSSVYKVSIDYTNTFVFSFQLTYPITFIAVLNPILQSPATTTPPPVPTTPVYPGPFVSNPAISTMDLTIGLDTNTANEQFYTNSKEVITNIIKYFSYTPDFVRLSFMTFDPFGAAGTGKYPLWTHNTSTMSDNLASMPFYPGTQSKIFSALDNFFFSKLGDFPLRPNIERVFIILTGTDAEFESAYKTSIPADIDQNDIKFIFVNLNTSVRTDNGPGTYYQNLALITGTGSNAAHWFDYQLNQNNAENILTNLYFDGNTLCNAPSSALQPVQTPISYSLPMSVSKTYCNYMNNVQTYQNPNGSPQSVLQVYFISYDLSNERDYIRIGVDGTEVSVLTGQYGSAFYCLPGSTITVTFQSKNGAIYNGYTSRVTATDATSCRTPPTPAPGAPRATFIDITKRH